MILKFNVKEQTISLVNTKSVPRIGSKDYLVLQFSFSSDWENLDKLVYLQSGDVSQPINIVDNSVEVPEWFTEQDSFNVTLFGTDGTTEVPTNVVSVQLEKSNDLWQKDAPEPQPSWLVSVLDAAELVKEATVHGPIIGSNGNWYTWDFESKQYIDTGVVASGGTSDHSKLTNRNADDQHPMSAITGLVGALGGKVSVADIINNLTTNAANKPLSAAQGVALKALIDAISIPEKLPNPHALTFTGAVSGSYDGSAAKTINIPSGGASGDYIPVPATAEVGQTVVVKAVDDSGKPTAWEAVDMPGGGGSGGGIHLIARVVTEANAASIEVTGLSTTAEVLSLRIYNPGSNCGNGLRIAVNGVITVRYAGTIAGSNVIMAEVRAWLYRDGGKLYGRSQMENGGINVYEWPEMGEITSITVDSPYNDGTTKYFQTGTIFEIYEGVYPNVK